MRFDQLRPCRLSDFQGLQPWRVNAMDGKVEGLVPAELAENVEATTVLKRVIDRRPHLCWAQALQALFRAAILLAERRSRLTERGFQPRGHPPAPR